MKTTKIRKSDFGLLIIDSFRAVSENPKDDIEVKKMYLILTTHWGSLDSGWQCQIWEKSRGKFIFTNARCCFGWDYFKKIQQWQITNLNRSDDLPKEVELNALELSFLAERATDYLLTRRCDLSIERFIKLLKENWDNITPEAQEKIKSKVLKFVTEKKCIDKWKMLLM